MLTISVSLPPMTSITAGIEKAMMSAVNTTLDAVEKDFQSSVKDFVHKPHFTKERAQVKGNTVEGRVWTDDENYARLNNGTTAHMVPSGGPRFMSYYTRYTKKTMAGRIPSSAGGTDYGSPRIRRFGQWMINGIDARQYDLLIRDKNQPVLEAALDRFLKAR